MAEILSLAGRPALSPFRLAKLLHSLAPRIPHRIVALAATYWHFVELARPLAADERATPRAPADLRPARRAARPRARALRSWCPRPARSRRGRRRRPTSRATAGSTRSRASSAASRTGIVTTRDGARSTQRSRGAAAAHPRPHDRGGARRARGRRARCSRTSRRGRSRRCRCSREGRAALERANVALGLALRRRRDRLPRRELHARSAAIRPTSSS